MKNRLLVLSALCLVGKVTGLAAYPIDGYDYTGIKRLDYYNLVQQGVIEGRQLTPGARLPLDQIRIRGAAIDLDSAQADAAVSQSLRGFLGEQASQYGIAMVDLSDPEKPVYAGFNDEYQANVGSVGKIIVALALYQQLAELYPDDIAARVNLLKTKQITADQFIERASHEVRIWQVDERKLEHRKLRVGGHCQCVELS